MHKYSYLVVVLAVSLIVGCAAQRTETRITVEKPVPVMTTDDNGNPVIKTVMQPVYSVAATEKTFSGASRTTVGELGQFLDTQSNANVKNSVAGAINKNDANLRMFEKVPMPGNPNDARYILRVDGTATSISSTTDARLRPRYMQALRKSQAKNNN